jgi:hypothetical protein
MFNNSLDRRFLNTSARQFYLDIILVQIKNLRS